MDQNARPELGELLGEGATAHVFAAVDGSGAAVVVKVLKPNLARDPVIRTRFLREARAAAQISHSRLVPVLAYGESGDGLWLTMPRLAGGSLATALRGGPFELAAAARLAEDVAGGLDALHAGGIVHRDLKPSNVLFDNRRVAHVTDFGLATSGDWTQLTQGGALLGTPHYIAPELIAGEPATSAADLYSFGCLLWEATTGAPPFAGRSLFDVGLAHLHEEPPEPALPPDVTFALRAALAKDPQRRPATAHAVAALLRVAVLSSARRA
jgi:serine/threonine protein kinase